MEARVIENSLTAYIAPRGNVTTVCISFGGVIIY